MGGIGTQGVALSSIISALQAGEVGVKSEAPTGREDIFFVLIANR